MISFRHGVLLFILIIFIWLLWSGMKDLGLTLLRILFKSIFINLIFRPSNQFIDAWKLLLALCSKMLIYSMRNLSHSVFIMLNSFSSKRNMTKLRKSYLSSSKWSKHKLATHLFHKHSFNASFKNTLSHNK